VVDRESFGQKDAPFGLSGKKGRDRRLRTGGTSSDMRRKRERGVDFTHHSDREEVGGREAMSSGELRERKGEVHRGGRKGTKGKRRCIGIVWGKRKEPRGVKKIGST